MRSIWVGPRPQAALVSALLCVALAGCGGTDPAQGTPDPAPGTAAADASATADACAALGRFSVTFQHAVSAVKGGDTHEVHGALAGLKEQYISVAQALKEPAPEAYDDITRTMDQLTNAVTHLPRDANGQHAVTGIDTYVSAVDQVVADAHASLECPS